MKRTKLNKSFIINLLLLTFTLIICFAWLEVFFKYKLKWSKTTSTAVNLPIFKESTYRSWDLEPNAYARSWFEKPVPEIKINSIWLRNDEIPDIKTKKRIMLLWDSFVFWMWAQQYHSISEYLNNTYAWKKYTRVINAWVIGQTIDDAYLYLKYDWIKLKPDVVVYNFFVWNDITELRRHIHTYSENWELLLTEDSKHYINDYGFLRKHWKKEPNSYFLLWLNSVIFWLNTDATLTWPVFFADNDPRWDINLHKYWWIFINILKQMNNFCKNNDIKFIVNILPMDVQVSKRYWHKYPKMPFWENEFNFRRPQKRIIKILDDLEIEYIDLLPKFQDVDKWFAKEDVNKFLYFKQDPHFNRLWNRRAANSIYLHLMNKWYLDN